MQGLWQTLHFFYSFSGWWPTSIKPDRGIPEIIQKEDDKVKIAVPTREAELLKVRVNEKGEYMIMGHVATLKDIEKLAVRLIGRSGYKAKMVISADYEAPYEEYMLLLRLAENLKIKTIINEVDEETKP